MASLEKCMQCGRPAIMDYGGSPLCVERHYMMQMASYLQISQVAANLNYLSEKIAQGTGYIVPPTYIQIPPAPFIGDSFTLNHINVSNSTVGAINTGTVGHLDAAITMFKGHGNAELASAIKEFTQALIDNHEIEAAAKNDSFVKTPRQAGARQG